MDETNFGIDENQPRPQMGPGYQNGYQNGNQNQIFVSDYAQSNMLSMGKWMKFLGILGIIAGSLLILLGLVAFFGGIALTKGYGAGAGLVGFAGFLYLIGGGIAIFLGIKLFNAGKGFKNAALYTDSQQLDDAISNQNTYFGCMGVMAIVYICFAVLGLIFGIVGASSGGF